MSYAGIDYGHGTTNRDPETGIRYGVISQGTVGQAWYDQAEADYGDDPTCPKCGNVVKPFDGPENDKWYGRYRDYGCNDYECDTCEHTLDSEDVFGDEPVGWSYSDEQYELTDCLDSDIMVLKSPFYTFAQLCSPCVPGAGNLDGAMAEGIKTFCLGHEWFEDKKAPYPVYRIADDMLVVS